MVKALHNMIKTVYYHRKEPYEVTIYMSQNEGIFLVKDSNTLFSTRFCQKLILLNGPGDSHFYLRAKSNLLITTQTEAIKRFYTDYKAKLTVKS